MESGEKKFIIILIIVAIIIICILVGLRNNKNKQEENDNTLQNSVKVSNELEQYVQKMEDGSKVNISKELNKAKNLDGLQITNIQFKEIGSITTLLADVENKTELPTKEKAVKVEILDKEGNIITQIEGTIDPIPVGEKVKLNMSVTVDVANAYDFRITNK